ncbi:hypothetical protein [Aequorivita antarctica]|uniref:STAS/SEC14 domain-containing protein n=1 Tax=Aequorivita antarctica TaxID=153266 RepID=A0A5C6Z3T9_9FLAO|nr:hypothetical protein [Aequorivita antarctica]TXD74193.1 hypothetical protein ESU54_02770 [Aequorivita antarctica]SRX75953.1 hypothetical protein AEQU3_02951 [Aequorivita antarctica]
MEKIHIHNLPPGFRLKKTLETEIGMVYFYENIVVFEAKEGIIMSYKTGFSILLKGLNYLGAKPWVYLSNRVHSYSIKPMDYKYLNKVPTLRAVGVVNYYELGHSNAELEAKFCKKPFQMFDNLTEAVVWGKGYL